MAGIYATESRRFLEYSLRWRNIPKPSIAAVQGVCIAGGLLLAWPCDLIIAADNAKFSDPVVNMGIGGVEYHGHTWEWGARKAKEMLFTGRSMTAEEAERLGMVNKVVPLDDLRAETRALAEEIAKKHPFALRQAKRAVNQTLDVMGFYAAVQSVFDVHQTGHGNALSESGLPILMLLDDMKTEIAKPANFEQRILRRNADAHRRHGSRECGRPRGRAARPLQRPPARPSTRTWLPQFVTREDGTNAWRYEGTEVGNVALNAVAGRPKEEYGIEPTSFAELRAGSYDIAERVKDMDANGVLGSCAFPPSRSSAGNCLPGQRTRTWPWP